MKVRTLAAILIALCSSSFAQAQKWADLTVTFVYDGTPPEPKEVPTPSADCAALNVTSESLLVDKATKGIANMVFMVDKKKSSLVDASIHPELLKVSDAKPVLDNVKCRFVPHVLSMRAGQSIDIKNSDSFGHNAKFSFFNNKEENLMIPGGSSKGLQVKNDETAPIPVECNIHPFMKSYVIVADHPYVGISDDKGVLKIEKLPAGVELTFKLWHESQNKFDEVTVNGKKESWKKGVTKITLKEGANDLGKVVLDASKFKN